MGIAWGNIWTENARSFIRIFPPKTKIGGNPRLLDISHNAEKKIIDQPPGYAAEALQGPENQVRWRHQDVALIEKTGW